MRYALKALYAVSVCALALTPAAAQTGKKPKPATSGAQAKPSNEVVGLVNGKPFTLSQVLDRVTAANPTALSQIVGQALGDKAAKELFGAGAKSQMVVTRQSLLETMREKPHPAIVQQLDQMLQEEAIRQEATKLGVAVTEPQVDEYLNNQLKRLREAGQIPPEMTDDQFLASRNLSRPKVKNLLRPQAQLFALVRKDAEQKQGRPFGPEDFMQARHILLMFEQPAPDAKPEDVKKKKEELLTKMKQIAAEIKEGKSKFEDAAQKHSQDGSRMQGGDLGPFVRGQMVPEFEKAAFALKPGELSEPVETQFGYHLIRVDKLGKDLTEGQRNAALDQLLQRKAGEYLPALRARAKVVNNLTPAGPNGMSTGQLRPAPANMVRPTNVRVPTRRP